MNGTIVGSYRILDTISVGGMGTVYRAEHTLIGRLAAVKILHPELCANRAMVNRFFNEAKTTTSIKHPGIVEVFDFGYMASGHAYLIMEFLDGIPLSHRVRARGPIPAGEAAVVLRSVCIALSAAHDKGIVHRDLKPDNIMVVPDPDSALGERTKILDFGIAKLTDIGLADSTTKTGAVMGTPTYMSPEQCRGSGDIDMRADLYSIGCMFYELVTGRPPFISAGAGEMIGSHLFVAPEPPSNYVTGLSPATESLIMRLLEKLPDHRVQTARELAQLLGGIAQAHGWMALGEVSRPSLSEVAVRPVALTPAMAIAPITPTTAATTIQTAATAPGRESGATSGLPGLNGATEVNKTLSPTTLSGMASEISEPSRKRRGIGLVIAGGLLAATAAGVVFMVVSGEGKSKTTASQPGSSTQPATPAPMVAPAPVQPTTMQAQPATTTPETAQPVATPEPAQPAATQEPAQAGSTATPTVTATPAEPAVPATTAQAKPAPHASTTAATPTAAKPAAKPNKKPAKKPAKAGSANDSTELLEQDI